MEFKGTKGEWVVKKNPHLTWIESPFWHIATVSEKPNKKHNETEANAKLIAAAPELLDALNRIKNLKPSDTMDSHGNWSSAHHYVKMRQIAEEAIEKALK